MLARRDRKPYTMTRFSWLGPRFHSKDRSLGEEIGEKIISPEIFIYPLYFLHLNSELVYTRNKEKLCNGLKNIRHIHFEFDNKKCPRYRNTAPVSNLVVRRSIDHWTMQQLLLVSFELITLVVI